MHDCTFVDSGPSDTECLLFEAECGFCMEARAYACALCDTMVDACSLSISVERLCIKLNEAEAVKDLPRVIWSAQRVLVRQTATYTEYKLL